MKDYNNLEQLYRMTSPVSLNGVRAITLGDTSNGKFNFVKELLDTLFNVQGHGALSVVNLKSKLDEMFTKAESDEIKKLFLKTIGFHSNHGTSDGLNTKLNHALDADNKKLGPITFEEITGTKTKKDTCIVTFNSGFMNPTLALAEKVQVFMNSLPNIVISRMVPYLDVEFQFSRGVRTEQKNNVPRTWSPGLMKFLLGANAPVQENSATDKMIRFRTRENQSAKDKSLTKLTTTAGMEMFTAPQTLLNPDANVGNGRAVSVLDPFRPFMSVENFVVNVQSAGAGIFSYKMATLSLKLHDRTRLTEIADFLRPQLYQDANSAPTLWVTYGWRYPDEPDNPYANFINTNMLVREAYGVYNASFSFDQTGQVAITLSLTTKGMSEIRNVSVNTNKALTTVKTLESVASDIKKILEQNGLKETPDKQLHSFMILNAAESGTYPDVSDKDIQDNLDSLKAAIKSGAIVDSNTDELTKKIDKLKSEIKSFKEKRLSETTVLTNNRFVSVIRGRDPFLACAQKDAVRKEVLGHDDVGSRMTSVVDEYNKSKSDRQAPTKTKSPIDKKGTRTVGFQKKVVSLGKLLSVFFTQMMNEVDTFDELQLFFYCLNDRAGLASNLNLAEFPIDMRVFLEKYREHVERKGTEFVTFEEFVALVIDTQITDPRSLAYGHRKYFLPFDENKKSNEQPEYADTKSEELYKTLIELTSFQMPAVTFFVETLYARKVGVKDVDTVDVLKLADTDPNETKLYKRILRFHMFDKANNPYKEHLKLRQSGSPNNLLIENENDKSVAKLLNFEENNIEEIKEFIARSIPTITYGSNASAVMTANLSSKQDALLATTQMQTMSKKMGTPSVLVPNGSDVGGLPLRIIPASLTMTTLGCPVLQYAQSFFIDFKTGTTADNIYVVTQLTHTISPGKFDSQITLTFADAYGKYHNEASSLSALSKSIQVDVKKATK